MVIIYKQLGKQDLEIVAEGNLYGKRLQFWRPKTLEKDWHCLGDTVTVIDSKNEQDKEPKLAIFYPEPDSEPAIKYIDKYIEKLGDSSNGTFKSVCSLGATTIWSFEPEEGYRTIGLVATPNGEKPNAKTVKISQVRISGGYIQKSKQRLLVYDVRDGEENPVAKKYAQNKSMASNNAMNFITSPLYDVYVLCTDKSIKDAPARYKSNTFLWINDIQDEEVIRVGNFSLVWNFQDISEGKGSDKEKDNYTISREKLISTEKYGKDKPTIPTNQTSNKSHKHHGVW